MKKKNPKIVYDKKSNVLSVEVSKSKSSDSEIRGNVVLDYDKKGRIVRVNFYDFSFEDFRKHQRVFRNFARDHTSSLAAR